MTKRGIAVGVALAALVLITAGPASALGPNKCTSAKLKATGKKAQARAKCYAKAVQKGVGVDPNCLSKASLKFSTAFAKAETRGACIAPSGDSTAIENKVDTFVDTIRSDVNSSGPGPDTCDSKKIAAAGKKAASKEKCQAKAVAKGSGVDPLCLGKAESKFSSAISKAETANQGPCTHTGQTNQLESAVNAFVNDVNGELETASTTSSTTTTTTSSTTTTTAPPNKLLFTTTLGTTSCGSGGLLTPASPPTSGTLWSDTGCSASVTNLGLSCLYFGGGKATIVPPGEIPNNATSVLSEAGGNLSGNAGSGPKDCTKGAGPGKHCINGFCNSDANCGNVSGACVSNKCNAGTQTVPVSCTSDSNCGGSAGACALDANCYFGPPLPIPAPPPNDALTTCVLNVVQTDAGGTVNIGTGDSSVSLPLSSRVYITGNSASPCPTCISGTCDNSWSDVNSSPGEDNGDPCSSTSASGTTIDCRPPLAGFQAPLPVNLTPLTSGTASMTNATGQFCPSQTLAASGAFGQATARCITETGAAGGDLSDNNPHAAKLGAVFCIPKTGNVAVDGVANLPGPGAIGLNGVVQFMSPGGAFLDE